MTLNKKFSHLRACLEAKWCSDLLCCDGLYLCPLKLGSPQTRLVFPRTKLWSKKLHFSWEIFPRNCFNLAEATCSSIREEKSTLFLDGLGFLPFAAFLRSVTRLVLVAHLCGMPQGASKGFHQGHHLFGHM